MTNDTEETILWRGHPSQWTNFGTYLVCLLLAGAVVAAYFVFRDIGPLIFLGLVIPVVWAFSRWLGTRFHVYEVSSERIKVTTGLLSPRTKELDPPRVRPFSPFEPFCLHPAGCGTSALVTADRSTPQIVLHAVPKAAALKDEIRTHTERMR